MNDIELIKHLWQKYSYRDAQGIKSDRKRIIEDYESETGTELSIHTLKKKILSFDREALFETKEMTFNERTDDIIDQSTKLLTENDLIVASGLDPLEFELGTSNTINRSGVKQ